MRHARELGRIVLGATSDNLDLPNCYIPNDIVPSFWRLQSLSDFSTMAVTLSPAPLWSAASSTALGVGS